MIAGNRVAQWYNLGVETNGSLESSLEAAGLVDWNMRLEPLQTQGRFHKEMFEVQRDNPHDGGIDTLGVVGKNYKILPNEELFEFADALVHGGGTWDAVGAFANDTRVFGVMSLPSHLKIDDPVEQHLMVHTTHDGSGSISVSMVALRTLCTNALTSAMRNAKLSFKIRHTQSLEGRMTEARHALEIADLYFDEFSFVAQEMIDTTITNQQFEALIETVYPKTDSARGQTIWDQRFEEIVGIYNGETLDNVPNSQWKAYNAITEWMDWGRRPSEGQYAASSGFSTVDNNMKTRVLELARSL